MNVQDIGEQGLLQRLQAFCPTDVVGDDGAVLPVKPGRSLVVTTDVLVDGVHFSDRTTHPTDAGWRAAAANLSDLAAMGATPLGITVGLGVPGQLSVGWIEQLYQGLFDCLQQYGTAIVGGDVVRSPVTTVSITAFGEVAPDRIIRRGTAQPGQAIVVTGVHGASRAGLELLLHPDQGQSLSPAERTTLIQAHQRPKPRLDVLPLLWEILDQTNPSPASPPTPSSHFPHPPSPVPPTSPTDAINHISTIHPPTLPPSHPPTLLLSHSSLTGMDSSDGLADAIIQICCASRVGARIDRRQIPFPTALTQWISQAQAWQWALYGGEDFELVLCLPPPVAQMLVAELGQGARIIGITTSDSGIWLVDSNHIYPDEPLTLEQGFQHFS